MPKAYIIAELDIFDAEEFGRYREQVSPLIKKYGGTYLARGGRLEVLEGEAPLPRVVIVEFPSFEQARAFHAADEYQPVKDIRRAAAKGNLFVVDGG